MLPHAFSHDGDAYEVSFSKMDGQWFAAVSRSSTGSRRVLPAFGDDSLGPFSNDAIRAGYIGLAEWLIRNGDWLEAADSPLLQPHPARAPIDRERTAPRLDRSSQEHIGRELQAMYADVLDEGVPEGLLSLLGAPEAAAEPQSLSRAA